MSNAKPGGSSELKPVETEFASFGGDARLLDRLVDHSALAVIHCLDQEESEMTKAAFLLDALYQLLNDYRGYTHELTKISTMATKAQKWMKVWNKTALEVLMAKSLYGQWKRTGNFLSLPDRYFYAGFLVPYTAFLDSSNGKGIPKWSWIERWMAQVVKAPVADLRVWWRKEVINRKTWPPKTLLYALASGSAVYFESNRGRNVKWPVAWSAVRHGLVKVSVPHPHSLKRRPEEPDRAYLESVFRWVPLIRKSWMRVYPNIKIGAANVPDPLEGIIKKEGARRMETWPLRQKAHINKLAGREVFNIGVEREKLRKELTEGTPPDVWRYLQRKMKKAFRKTHLKNGDGL